MKRIAYSIITLILVLSGCEKDDSGSTSQSGTFEIKSTSSTQWKYFSFAENDTITVADPSTSTSWDLAFQRYRIRTNSGRSGVGQGGAANTFLKGQQGFDALKVIPDTLTFSADDTVNIAVMQGYAQYIVNPVLYTWFTMEPTTMGTQIVPTDDIYVIRTAQGKYAKLWIKSYYSAENISGYVAFQFKYQPDGSRNME
jgi:hypothetical protein